MTGESLDPSLAELARRIHGRSCLAGRFVLRSGAQSSFYFDKYAFEADPVLLRDIARAMLPMLPADLDLLTGLELGGVPLATVLSQLSGLPTRFVRKHAKRYGTCRLAEGGKIADRRMAIVEDVVTSGGQVIESARALHEQHAVLVTVLCVIDRQAGGAENLARQGLELRSLFTTSQIERAVAHDPLTCPDTGLHELVEAVRALSYGRPSDRTVEGMLRERRGTCSTKHLFLAQVLAERFPATRPQIVHRVYRLDRALAHELFGAHLAARIPVEGLVDIHRYLTITVDGQRIAVDATFPGAPWDGRSSLVLACGPGTDHPAGEHADAEKRALEQEHCDPSAREPFIAALESHAANSSGGAHAP